MDRRREIALDIVPSIIFGFPASQDNPTDSYATA